jgi:ASPIC and UnbV/FG-GAP-like repeat
MKVRLLAGEVLAGAVLAGAVLVGALTLLLSVLCPAQKRAAKPAVMAAPKPPYPASNTHPAPAWLVDVAPAAGLDMLNVNGGVTTKKYIIETTGSGVAVLDYDNDGWPDLMQINGHVYPEIDGHEIGQTYKNPRLVYRNLGQGRFKDVSAEMGPGITERFSSRGAAFGDYDNDGDVDALILNMNDVPSLLRNDGGNAQNWIKIKLIGTKCNRTAIGARVRVLTGTHTQTDEVHSGSSVMSQCDLRLHFGLGMRQTVDVIEVKWPTTQKVERFTQVKANQILTIREGSGIVSTMTPKTK